MRILIVSDIHANPAALSAITEPFDVCLCLGDLVDYGLDPLPCLDWVRRQALVCVRGNHDHGVAQDVVVPPMAGFRGLTAATRPLNRAKLGPADRRYLAQLPTSHALTLAGLRFFLVHASLRDPLDEYAPGERSYWEKWLKVTDADVVCVGHTHQQYAFDIDGKLVINPGAVGIQRDGDPRLGYAVVENGKVTLKRVEWPVEEAVRAAEASPVPEAIKAQLAEVYRTGRLAVRSAPGSY